VLCGSLIHISGPKYIQNQVETLSLGFLVAGILLMAILFIIKKPHLAVWGCCLMFLALGMLRFEMVQFAVDHSPIRALNDRSDKVTLEGDVIDEPIVKDSFQSLKVKVGNGIILVSANLYPQFHYLDEVQIIGKLKTPQVFDDFDYKSYLAKDGIYSVMDYASVVLITSGHRSHLFSYVYEKILFIKKTLMGSVDLMFSMPQNFLIQGIVYGDDTKMPADLKNEFNATGLSHITAVSGGNIVLAISMAMVVLLALGCWRRQALLITLFIIWFYIALVGFPASAVRAGIMGTIAVLSGALGRQNSSWRALVLAATLMLLQNPMLLLYDVGFQLSFLASMGIIQVKPLIDRYIFFGKRNIFIDILSVTLSAQIFALPVIVYTFGNVSVVSLITNLLVLPVIPAIMAFGFLTSVLGMVWHLLGWAASLPTWFLVTYVLKILHLFSRPWATIDLKNISWVWFAGYYILLAGAIWYLKKRSKDNIY
jgi:competence protein ComEC